MPGMKDRLRILIASLVGSLAALLPLTVLVIASLVNPETVGIEPGDEAPIMSANLLLVLIPCIYPILVIGMGGISEILLSRNQLTRKNLLLIAFAISMTIGIIMGFQSPFGLKDQLIGTAIFFALSLLSSVCGGFSWWFVASIGQNKQ